MAVHDHKTIVVEYSDLSSSDKNLRDDDDNLVYDLGNICSHYFSVHFLRRLETVQPVYHVARKNIEVWDVEEKKVRKAMVYGGRYPSLSTALLPPRILTH